MDENTPMVDTSLWSLPSTPITNMELQPTPKMETVPSMAIKLPDNSNLLGAIRFDATNKLDGLSKGGSNGILNMIAPNRNKQSLTSEVSMQDTHEKLNDGSWLPKYKSYQQGVDNDARLSATQSKGEKFWNPLKRFASNTELGVVDLAANVYGIGAAAITGRFDAIYNNDFAKYVDDLTTKNNLNYKNYYDQAEKNQNLGLNLQTWDKVLGGAEFTARMLVSEAVLAAVTDGASLPSTFAKLGLKTASLADKAVDVSKISRIGADISKMLKFSTQPELAAARLGNAANASNRTMEILNTVANRGKIADNLVKARFAITSPLYESGFEARHFQKEAENQFWDYYRSQGRMPTQDEVNKFSEKLSGSSNAVFMTNMAILAPSNLALVGDMFGISNPIAKWVSKGGENMAKSFLKLGTEVGEDGLHRAIKANLFHKIASVGIRGIQGGLIEGVYEEGSQGIASNTFKNYVASSYDPTAMKNTADYIDAFSKAFKDQFGTKEGFEEIAIGALIGGIMGIGGAVNSRSADSVLNKYKQQERIADIQNKGEEFINQLKSNDYTNEQLLSLFSGANRFQNLREKMEEAGLKGDKLKEASLQAQSFISLLDQYHSVGKSSDFTKMISNTFEGMDNTKIAEATGLDISQVDDFKREQIENMNAMSKNYETALEAGKYLFGRNVSGFTEIEVEGKKYKVNGQNLSNALAFSSTMAFFNQKYADESFEAFQTKLAEVLTDSTSVEKFGAIGVLKRAHAKELGEYQQLTSEENTLKSKFDELTRKIEKIESVGENAQERLNIANELLKVKQDLQEVSNRKDMAWKGMVNNFYKGHSVQPYIPQLALDEFTDRVKELDRLINNDSFNINETDRIALNKLFDLFDQSNDNYKEFAEMANDLTNSNLKFRTYNHMFGAFRAKMDKSINEHTRDTLERLLNHGRQADINTVNSNERLTPTSTDTPTDTPTDDKVNNNEDTREEDNIERDPINNTSRDTELDELSLRKEALEEEFEALENGELSDDLQNKISEIDEKIEKLKEEIGEKQTFSKTIDEIENFLKSIQQRTVNGFLTIPGLKLQTSNSLNIGDEVFIFSSGQSKKGTVIKKGTASNITIQLEDGSNYEIQPSFASTYLIIDIYKMMGDNNTTKKIDIVFDGNDYVALVDDVFIFGTTEEEVQNQIDAINNAKNNSSQEEEVVNEEVDNINKEIERIEKEIQKLEKDQDVSPNIERNHKNSSKANYQQYSYVKPNGDTIIGYLEVNKGILQIVNEDEIVDIKETTTPLINIIYSISRGSTEIEGLNEIQSDFIMEGREIHINGQVYTLPKSAKSLDDVISTDKEGNYIVKLRTQKGGNITLRGSLADEIVYNHLINQLEQYATDEELARLQERARKDSEIAEKYGELESKTKDRDNAIDKAKQEKINKQKEIQELENKKLLLPEERQIELANEIISIENEEHQIKDEIADKERKDNIEQEIQELEKKIINDNVGLTKEELKDITPDSEIPFNEDIARLIVLKREFKKYKDLNEPFNPMGTPKEKLQWIIDNIFELEMESVDDLSKYNKPTEDEIYEYEVLSEIENPTKEQQSKIEELAEKMAPFYILDDLTIGGINLKEVLDLYSQQKKTENTESTQRPEFKEEDLQNVLSENETEEIRNGNSGSSPKVGLNYDGVYIKKRMKGGYRIYHLHLGNILNSALQNGNKPEINILNIDSKGNKTIKETIYVTPENVLELAEKYDSYRGIEVKLSENNKIGKNLNDKSFYLLGDMGTFVDMMGLIPNAITGQPTNFILLYEQNVDGTYQPRESDYKITRDGMEIPFDKELLNSIKPGETVTLEFDPKDDYNKKLSKKEYASKGRIYVKKNGKLVNILKGKDESKSTDSKNWQELSAVRDNVVTNGSMEVRVSDSYLGFPITTLNSDGTTKQIPIDTGNVLAYGYVDENGELQGDIKGINIDNKQYITPLSKRGVKSPVMAFKAYGKIIAFPITLESNIVDYTEDINSIMESNMSDSRKAFEINNMLQKHGLYTDGNIVDDTIMDIAKAKEVLSNVEVPINILDKTEFENANKTSFIDMRDPFKSSKLVFEFPKIDSVVENASVSAEEILKESIESPNKEGLDNSKNNIC